MRIVIFGLTVSSSWGNGHAVLWRGLLRELAAEGHHITFFEHDQPYYAQNRDLSVFPWGGELVLYTDWDALRPRRMPALMAADVAIVTSYCADGVAATQAVMDAPVGVRCFYDMDTPVTLARLAAGEGVEYIGADGLSGFDIVFSYTGGRALDALRTQLGARHVVPLYGWVDPDQYVPATPRAAYAGVLSYIGTYAADRQAALEKLLIEPARRLPAEKFVIAGAQYPAAFPWTPNIFFVRHLPPPEHPIFYASSRATLNVTRAPMARMGWCPSGRLFEAAACGATVLSDWWEGLGAFFIPGDEILVAQSTDDILGALSMSDAELRRIGQHARERALSEHSARHRAAQLLAALDGVKQRARAA